jgi:WhiB family redox-sensing transcriptional regulator
MSETRYSARDHDAEWVLQQERCKNDAIVRKQKRTGKKRRSTAVTSPRRLAVTTPDQRAAAAQHMQDAAERLGAPAADLELVLDMLGLAGDDLTTTYTASGERRRFVAACPTCERPTIQLKTDRTFISHPRQSKQALNDETRCPGSGKLAANPTPAAAPPPKQTRVIRFTKSSQRKDPLPKRTACQDEDPELFFPESYSEKHARQIAKAIGVCGRCDLAKACLRYALAQGPDLDGIWGGTVPDQRKALLPNRKAAA